MASASPILPSLPDLPLNPLASPSERKFQFQLLLDSKEKQLEQAGALSQRVLAQQIELEDKIHHFLEFDAERRDGDLDADAKEHYRELADTIKAWDLENAQLSSVFCTKRLIGDAPPSISIKDTARDGPERPKLSSPPTALSRRAKNAAHRVDDVEFAFEVGSGLLTEVRRLQDLLGERDKVIQDMKEEKEILKKSIESLRTTLHSREQSSDKFKEENWNLEINLQELRAHLSDSQSTTQRLESEHKELTRLLSTARGSAGQYKDEAERTKTAFDEFKVKYDAEFAHSQQRMDSLVQIILAHEKRHECEALYAEGCIYDAIACLLEIVNVMSVSEEVRANSLIMDWLAKFKNQCISTLEISGDEASSAGKQEEAVTAYSAALSLSPSTPNTLLVKWASIMLIHNSVDDALSAAAKFSLPGFLIYATICDFLRANGRALEAIQCFRRMQTELGDDTRSIDEIEWTTTFETRCVKTLEQSGDAAMHSTSYKDAIGYYTAALTLNPLSTQILIKRSKAQAEAGSWDGSIEDADAAIELDRSSPHGYERRHVALLGARRYDEAISAFNDMLVRFEQSPDPATRKSRNQYVSPSQTMAAVRIYVERTQRDAPLVLINTETGRLYDKRQRMDEFEADPRFKELVASITTMRDNSRIAQTVQEYFRYATLSHTWEGVEPLFHDVLHNSVHQLATSPSSTFLKLAMFCSTVQEIGLRWAWSDTCCINKADGSVLQESLASMFQWYHESALTIVHLKDVLPDSELGALTGCFWNTRAWTLQEFFASRVIRFYTEDWKPYLPLETMHNHKDSSTVMAEMAAATGVDVQVLLSLRPGSEDVRQKLCLAATRTATKQEDMAYSLFGIFDVSIPVTYGEGQQRALGRLLQEVLTRSGDVTVLAWTGRASDYNSCLPAEIDVYRDAASPYIPLPIEDDRMDMLVTELRTSPGYLSSAIMLYDRLVSLPTPRLFSRRLSLSCIMFPLRGLLTLSSDSQHIFRVTTSALGIIEIETTEDLSSSNNLVLVHPWIRCLLDPTIPSGDLTSDDPEPLTPLDGDEAGESDTRPHSTPHAVSPSLDKLTRALRLFARLRQPFGALLLASLSHNEYKRVACDCPIVVQLLDQVLPRYLAQKVRTLDIL